MRETREIKDLFSSRSDYKSERSDGSGVSFVIVFDLGLLLFYDGGDDDVGDDDDDDLFSRFVVSVAPL